MENGGGLNYLRKRAWVESAIYYSCFKINNFLGWINRSTIFKQKKSSIYFILIWPDLTSAIISISGNPI